MAIQPMALQVQNTQGNALASFASGQQHAQQTRANDLALAQQTLQNVGSLAFGVMGGRLDGQPDPALWEEALDMIGSQGVNVDMFRGRPDLAPVIAKASVDTLGQLQLAQNERELAQRMAEFDFKVQEALKGTADQQNFAAAQADPGGFGAFLDAKNAPNPPAQVAEYNFYAEQERAAGREPKSFEEYQISQKGQGLTVTTNPDGTTTVTQGGSGLKLTEVQGKDIGFYTRGLQANSGLDALDGQLTDWAQQNAGAVPLGLGNALRSPEFRQAKVEADNFLAAILRKDTGAAITDNEFALYGPMFLPQPFDDPATMQLKRQKRATALLALRSGLGTAEIVAAANEASLGLDQPTQAAQGQPTNAPEPAQAGDPARPTTDAEYDALPSGALFIDPDDGQTYRKP